MDRQLLLDFEASRKVKLAILRNARLPAGHVQEGGRRVTVAACHLMSTLRAIDDHAGQRPEAWLKHSTLAAEIHASQTTAERTTLALANLDLITITRKKTGRGRTTCNHYSIVWGNLFGTIPEGPEKERIRADLDARRPRSSIPHHQQINSPPVPSIPHGGRSIPHSGRILPPPGSAEEAPPSTPPPAAAGPTPADVIAWREVAEELRKIRMGTITAAIRSAKSHQIDATELLYAIEVYRANRDKLRSAGAILFWMANDRTWPAHNLREPGDPGPGAPAPPIVDVPKPLSQATQADRAEARDTLRAVLSSLQSRGDSDHANPNRPQTQETDQGPCPTQDARPLPSPGL